jgi:hypothetical protein
MLPAISQDNRGTMAERRTSILAITAPSIPSTMLADISKLAGLAGITEIRTYAWGEPWEQAVKLLQSVDAVMVLADATDIQILAGFGAFLEKILASPTLTGGLVIVARTSAVADEFRKGFPQVSPPPQIVAADNPTAVREAIERVLDRSDSRSWRNQIRSIIETLPPNVMSNLQRSAADARDELNPLDPSMDADDSDADSAEAEEAEGVGARFSDLNEADFVDAAWEILKVARKLGRGRERPQTSMRRLMASILMRGLEGRESNSPHWLVSKSTRSPDDIQARISRMYSAAPTNNAFRNVFASREPSAEEMTPHLKQTLDLAARLANESNRSSTRRLIAMRHLLGAAIRYESKPTNIYRFLSGFGFNVHRLREDLLSDLPNWNLAEDVQVWRRLLSGAIADKTLRMPRYASDSAVGKDLIGITREVEAMASLLSAWTVEPPLSIGLFGEWGSGKTFFMQKIKERVRQIAAAARASKQHQRDFGYYKNIVQVEFNAWHYVEGNLWASLVEHIFTNLKLDDPDLDSSENLAKRQAKFLNQAKEKIAQAQVVDKAAQALSDEADKQKVEAQKLSERLLQEAKEARERAAMAEMAGLAAKQQAESREREAVLQAQEAQKVRLKDLLDEVAGSDEIKREVKQDLEKLGIPTELPSTVLELRDAIREGTSTAIVLRAGFEAFRQDKQKFKLLVWALIVPTLLALLVWGGVWLANNTDSSWLRSLTVALASVISGVATVAGAVVAFYRRYRPKLQPLVEAVDRLKQKREILERRVKEAQDSRVQKSVETDAAVVAKQQEAEKERRTAQVMEVEAAQARETAARRLEAATAAQKRAKELRNEAEQLQQDADALRPERQIAALIQDRARAMDYRRFLGVPALVRRDFGRLSEMFLWQRKNEEDRLDGIDLKSPAPPGNTGTNNGDVHNDPAVVNRIILYVDDLDRCDSDKVVEVLRMIHLLLAFPLFVVVVAVDARWMKRSLKDQYSLMLSDVKQVTGEEGNMDRQTHMSIATPDDYLEKIFQVPFWIKPLSKEACMQFVSNLTIEDLEKPANKLETALAPNSSVLRPVPSKEGSSTTRDPEPESDTKVSPLTPPPSTGGKAMDDAWHPIAPNPMSLFLTAKEREYMVLLAPLIGRSPRAVKRFVNCYRLLKSTLDPVEIAQAQDETFQPTMFLLALVTGYPEAAQRLITDLRNEEDHPSLPKWARAAAERLKLQDDGKWKEILPLVDALGKSGVRTIEPLIRACNLVDRFSFSPVRSGSCRV